MITNPSLKLCTVAPRASHQLNSATLPSSWLLSGPYKSVISIYEDCRSSRSILTIVLRRVFSRRTFLIWPESEKVAMYTFRVCWVPGKKHLISDALSRAPLFAPEEHLGLDIDTAISCLTQTSHPTMDLIFNSIDDDVAFCYQISRTTCPF